MTRRILSISFVVTAGCVLFAADAPAQERTVWDGVYTTEQAMRGAAGYAEACVSCHAEDLRGDSNTPSIVGVSFTFLWGDMSLGALFTRIRTGMPTDRPNSLPPQTYLDILAYILEANEFPAGDDELGSDPASLDRILIAASPR